MDLFVNNHRFDQLRMDLIDDWVGVVGKIYRKQMETVALPTINWLGFLQIWECKGIWHSFVLKWGRPDTSSPQVRGNCLGKAMINHRILWVFNFQISPYKHSNFWKKTGKGSRKIYSWAFDIALWLWSDLRWAVKSKTPIPSHSTGC